ncbi:MAG TPA: hypothetical protein VGT05_00880 [Patescibacteria group bacterium]|nr:hypothetical protein [Patescibacteria group bacterium]
MIDVEEILYRHDGSEIARKGDLVLKAFKHPELFLPADESLAEVNIPWIISEERHNLMVLSKNPNPPSIYYAANTGALDFTPALVDPRIDPQEAEEMRVNNYVYALRPLGLLTPNDFLVFTEGDEEWMIDAYARVMKPSMESFGLSLPPEDHLIPTSNVEKWILEQNGSLAICPSVPLPSHVASYGESQADAVGKYLRTLAYNIAGTKERAQEFFQSILTDRFPGGIPTPKTQYVYYDPQIHSPEMIANIVRDTELGKYKYLFIKSTDGRSGGTGSVGSRIEELGKHIALYPNPQKLQFQKGIKIASGQNICVSANITPNQVFINSHTVQRIKQTPEGYAKHDGNIWRKGWRHGVGMRSDILETVSAALDALRVDGRIVGPVNIDMAGSRSKPRSERRGSVIIPICAFVIEVNARDAGSKLVIEPFQDKKIDDEPIETIMSRASVEIPNDSFLSPDGSRILEYTQTDALKGEKEGMQIGIVGPSRKYPGCRPRAGFVFSGTENVSLEDLENLEKKVLSKIESW